MNTRQYTLSTGKTRITLQAGQTNIHKAAPGETYRVLKRQGEKDQEKLADDVVASRHGQDLQLDYADGTTLTLQDWFTQSDTNLTLPADGTSTQLMTPASTEGAALANGSHVFYAHGSPDALASMTSGHPGLENILSGLQNNSLVTGHQVTYLPQSHSYMGYMAGVLGLGGAVGVALASGGGGGSNNDGKQDNGGGEPAVNNSVELNFVGGPALSSNDLNVEIYQADGKTLIGTGTLGPNGSVTVSAGSYSGVVIVKLVNSGGAADYLDEATGVGKDLSAQLWSMGVISGDNSTLVLNINVLTTLAYTKAQQALGGTTDSPATLSAAQVADTSAAISSLFGVDDVLNTTVVATNGGSYDATDGLSAGEKYGLLLAAFSGAEANAGATTQIILDTVTAGINLGSNSSLSDGVQSLLIKGAAAATDGSGGLSLIIDTHAPVFTSATTASVDENIGAGQVVWTAVATDPSSFSYSLSTTGDSTLFSINAATGAVTLLGNPDFESKASYSFTVVATDAAGNASSQTVTLGINNLDEVAPTITSGTTATAIDENSGAGQVIYTATATDTGDISNGVTFSLKAGSDAGLTIDPITGAVTLTGNPDFESKASYSFTVVATDAAGNASSKTVTLGINNLDEVAPTITSGATATAIDENSGAGQVIYTATATDTGDGTNGAVSYSLGTTGDSALFSIDTSTGAVTLIGNPDFESKASYSFTVVATDAAGNASIQTVTLGINNLDEIAPTIISGAIATAIDENSGAGQVIYTATATDTGDGTNGVVSYSLGTTGDSALFSIDASTGAVTLTGNPDFESKASYSFTVVATDAAGNASSKTVTLGINNLDEIAPTITSGTTATAIDENSGAGQVVYTATATDTGDGTNGAVSYSLGTTGDSALFGIDASTGAVTLIGNPDYESKASYSFTVVATDAAGNASSRTVTLGINNLDEVAPTITSGTTATAIDENSGAGQVIYTATATDIGDGSNGAVSYSLGTTGDSALFSIDTSTGAVTLIGNPDFESKASYSFTVVATDAAGNASIQTVTLGINNLDEIAPTIISGTTATAIDENSGAGQVIYTATATDIGDGTNGVVTYSLGSNVDSALFSIDSSTGAVTLTGNPDYESKNSYSFTVIATDAAGNHSSQVVVLGINNLDEVAPTITSGTIATAIDENSGAGQVVYTATAVDAADGSNGVVIYSLGSTVDSALFSIDSSTGAVTLIGNPDFESKASYSFTVVATDAAGNASSRTVTLGINNLDEIAPTIISGITATTIDENSGAGQVVYTATAVDAADGSNGVVIYSLGSTVDSALFSIDSSTGAVTLIGNPDFESKASYSFTVIATDAAGNHSDRMVTLGINNLDEVAPTITSGAIATAINENSGAGQVIYTATATDTADISNGVTFSLKGDSDAGLTINPITGAVTLTGNPDFESKASYSFTVVATDKAGNHSDRTVTLDINNVDEVAPSFTTGNISDSYASATVSVVENSDASTAIYTAQAVDNDAADGGEHVSYSLANAGNGADAQYFTIDAATGAVTFNASPDYESPHGPQFTFNVVATDAAGHTTTQTVTVNVTDVDEIAPTVTLDGSSSGPVMLSPGTNFLYLSGFDTTTLGDGSFLVTWAGNNNGNYGIYAQRLSAQGVALGDAVQIASGASNMILDSTDSIISVTAINETGAYAVAWIGKNGTSVDSSIYAQSFNADGTPISAAVQLDGAASVQDSAPQIATLADGGYIVTWYISGGGGVYVQRFDDAGVAVGNTVPLAVSGSYDNRSPQVAVLDNGGYVVTWQGNSSGDNHIYVQQFDATGTGTTPVVLDGATGNNNEIQPQITGLANGGYVVTWSSYSGSNNNSTYVQQFDATGAKVGSIVVLDGLSNVNNGGDSTYPYVAALADGGYVITWMENGNIGGNAVYVQQFTAVGSKVGAAVQLGATQNNGELPRITALGDGGYVVTWMGFSGMGNDVYAQKFNASGIAVGDTVQLGNAGSVANLFPQVSAAGANGEYMVAWYSNDPASGFNDFRLYVQKFNADGSTYENLVVLNHDGNATVQSSESGIVYLVNDSVVVSQLSDITGAASDKWASTAVTANTSATISAANLAEGTYHAWAVDAAGNLSVISGSSVVVDNTGPVFTSATTAADITDNTATGDTVYTAAASDANGITYSLNDTVHFRINVSTGVVTLLSSPANATGAQFIVTATDAAGNQTTQTVTYNVVDTTPPGVILITDLDGVEHNGQNVTVQSTEAGTIYLVSDSVTVTDLNSLINAPDNLVNSIAVTANASTVLALTGLTDGTYHAYAVDASGNFSASSGNSVVVDNTVPVFTSAAIAADITDSTAVGDTVYTAVATDANGVSYSLSDNQHFNINSSTGVVTLLSSPDKATGAQFIVTATDAAGNQTTQTVTYNVVDTTPPGIMLVRDMDGVQNSSEMVLVQSTEAGTIYLVSDSVTVTDLNSLTNAADNLVNSVTVMANAGTTLALTGLDEGTYHAYAVDAAGNVSAISGSSVIVDNTAPVISGGATATGSTLTSGAAAGTQVYDANASDAHAITYSLDPDSLGLFNIDATTGVVTLSSAAVAGSYNFIVTATDAAGNHSSQTVTVEVAVGNNLDGSAVVSGSTTDTATQMTVNVGLEKLSNGNTVMEYMRQIGGDSATGEPTGALFDGVIRVLDANNNVVKTIDITVPAGYTMQDTQIKALANGGFVVAWSQVEALNWTDPSVHYAIYDNNGNLQSSDTLASTGSGVTIAAQSSANGGDFAISYQTMGPNTDQQQAVSVFHYNGSGFSTGTQTLIGGNSASQSFGGVTPPEVQLMKFQLTPGVLTALSDGSYVLASEVYDWIGTPGQSATSTPLGAFIFKLDGNGSLANFDGDTTWQRVNWNDEQGSPTNVIAFDGGFAVFSQEYRSPVWEVTLYNNNGTLITTTVQSNVVQNMGTQSYHAVDVGAMDKDTHSGLAWYVNGYLAGSATAYDNGTDLVFVFPDGNGGLSQVNISKTTGELTSDVTDSGITVPQGGQLYNPRIVSDGAGGYDITYSVLFDSDLSDGGKKGYAVGDIYQIGLNAPVAPTVTDAHIAITSTPGGADGSTYKVGDTVTAVWDNSASGDANTRAVTSVTMDFSQFGANTPATAYDDGTHGDAIAGDGKYTAQYTLTAGAINHVDSRNVAVTVTTANHGTATAADSTGLTVDNTAPVLTSSTPQDNVGNVAAGANLTLTFSEAVLAGSGHITLINDSNGSLSKFIDINDSSQVSISGNTVTINPTTDLAAGANYHVQIDSGALHDTAGNDYAGISTSTGLNFTTAFAGMGNPSTVVFDLTTGQSSDHNGRVFDANTAYTIYIKVNSTNFSLTGLDNNEMWSGAQNLGLDDKIVLVGTGSYVQGGSGGPVVSMYYPANAVEWRSGSFSGNAAGIAANGQFTRSYGDNVDLWNGTWAVNPNQDNQFAQAYMPAMPAGILTSQGLAFP